MLRTETIIRARYAETDQMGFVHHQNYVAYFEQARVEMLSQIGVPYKELEEAGFFLPVLEVNIKYLQSNTFDDELVVHCIIEEMPKVRINIRYEVYKEGSLTTTGMSRHGFINKEGKPCRPPKALIQATKKYFTES